MEQPPSGTPAACRPGQLVCVTQAGGCADGVTDAA